MDKAKDKTTASQTTDQISPVSQQDFKAKTVNPKLLAQIVTSLQSNLRQGHASSKTRGEVAGSTKKPWRQKGTGRARVGTKRNPVWRGGGVVFGPTPERNYYKKVNQKNKWPIVFFALNKKAETGEVLVIKSLPEINNTKSAYKLLEKELSPKNNLLVTTNENTSIYKFFKNIKNLTILNVNNLNLLDIAKSHKVIFLPQALEILKTKNE